MTRSPKLNEQSKHMLGNDIPIKFTGKLYYKQIPSATPKQLIGGGHVFSPNDGVSANDNYRKGGPSVTMGAHSAPSGHGVGPLSHVGTHDNHKRHCIDLNNYITLLRLYR